MAASHQVRQEVAHLVARDREADADVHAAAIAERDAAVDADDLTRLVEQRAAGVAGIDRRIDLDAVGIDEHPVALAFLVAMRARHDAERDRRREVRREQEGIAHCEHGLADEQRVRVAERSPRPALVSGLADEPQHREIAARIDAEHHRFVELAVRQADLLVAPVLLADGPVLLLPLVLPRGDERLLRRVVGRCVVGAPLGNHVCWRLRRRCQHFALVDLRVGVGRANDVVVRQHVATRIEDHAAATTGRAAVHHRAHCGRAQRDRLDAARFGCANRSDIGRLRDDRSHEHNRRRAACDHPLFLTCLSRW